MDHAKNNFYIVRHGQSENNVTGLNSSKLANKEQFALTKTGIDEVKIEAAEHNQFDLIYHSPFRRTRETAELFADTSNCPLISEPLLREIDVGEFELKSYSSADKFLQKHGPSIPYPGGESFSQAKTRAFKALDKIDNQNQNKNILIVTHGDLIEIFVLSSDPSINLSKFYASHNNGRKVYEL